MKKRLGILFLVGFSFLADLCNARAGAAGRGASMVADLEQETPRQADSFVNTWGMNTHFSYKNTPYQLSHQRVVASLEAMGVRHIRDGGTNPSVATLATFADLCSHGINHTIGFGIHTTAEQILTTVRQYKPECVDAVEPQNEYDGSKDLDWPSVLRAQQTLLYSTIKGQSAFSQVTVLGPALVKLNDYAVLGNFDSIMDSQNLHFATCDGNPLTRRYKNIDVATSKYNLDASSKPIWTTETAYTDDESSGCHVAESVAGRLVLRTQFELFNRKEPRIYWYELTDQPTDRMFGKQGFLNADGSTKPRYTAVKNLIALLSDRGVAFTPTPLEYSLEGDSGDIHHTLLQKRDGRYFLVLWREVESWDHASAARRAVQATQLVVNLPRNVHAATLYGFDDKYTLKGNKVEPHSGRFQTSVSDDVIILSFRT